MIIGLRRFSQNKVGNKNNGRGEEILDFLIPLLSYDIPIILPC